MSNPADPIQPDPNKKPQEQHGATGQPPSEPSIFDFELPPEGGSFTAPAAQREALDLGGSSPSLPPRPETVERPSSASFDFIELPPESELAGGSVVLPGAEPVSAAPESSVLDLAALTEVPGAGPPSGTKSVPDIDTLFPDDPLVSSPSNESITLPVPAIPDIELPELGPPSAELDLAALGLTPAGSASDLFGSSVMDLQSPDIPPSALDPESLSVPSADSISGDGFALPTVPPLDEVELTKAESVEPIAPASGWLEPSSSGSTPDVSEVQPASQPATPQPTGRSSFDFKLPSSGDLGTVPPPQEGETGTFGTALPPAPKTVQQHNASFDFINVGSDAGSGTGLKNVPLTPTAIDPLESSSAAPPPGSPASDSAVAVGAELPSAVKPASGWLDSDVLASPLAADSGDSDPLAASPPTAEAIESSDIFSGSRTQSALPVDQSDVIAATVSEAKPAGEQQPSEVSLNFEAIPGGSTVSEEPGDVRSAEDAGEATMLIGSGTDPESIHDMPDPGSDPLFDSSRLAAMPDLPDLLAAREDAHDYGSAPEVTADASSILADLVTPAPREPGAGSSHVPVEAPGIGRTLTPPPGEGSFDLTVPDEDAPVELFGENSETSGGESLNWHEQSGSDLFVEGRKGPDADSGRIDPFDSAHADEPSLSSAPSSIFTGVKVPLGTGSGESSGATEVEPGEAAEFTDHPTTGETAEPVTGRPGHSSADFQLPPDAPEDGGAIDWDSQEFAGKEASPSDVMRALADDEEGSAERELPTRERPRVLEDSEEEGPVVSVDWMSSSVESTPVRSGEVPTLARDKHGAKRQPDEDTGSAETKLKTAPAVAPSEKVKKPQPEKKSGGMLIGALAGAILAGAACAGTYFSGLVPNSEKSAAGPPTNPIVNPGGPGNQATPPPVATPGAAAQHAFAMGNLSQALEMVKARPATTVEERATAGSVRIYAKVNGTGTDADLQQGQKDLQQVIAEAGKEKTADSIRRAVKATVDLAISYEATGDTATARKLFTEARTKFPKYASIFDAQLDRIESARAGGTSFRFTPADTERLMLALGILLAEEPNAAPQEELPEAGTYYWKAIRAARDGKYKDAIDLIGQAKAAHVKRAKALAGRGINPLTDPLEQMFPRACDELAAHWRLKGELYANPAIADAIKKDGVIKTLDTLARASMEAATAKADFAKAEKTLIAAKIDLTKSEAAAKLASEKATKLESEVAKLDKAVKAEQKSKLDLEDRLKVADTAAKAMETKLATAAADLKASVKESKDRQAALDSLAKELKPAVSLPEKWTPADLVAGTKSLASLVKAKDLKVLAERLTKAEAAAKTATDKLATETKKLTDKYEGDIKTLKDGNTAEVKKLTDTYAAKLKTLQDTAAADFKKLKAENAEALAKQKEASATEVKKLMDANVVAEKKLADKYASDTQKLKDELGALLKVEQAKVEAERKAAGVAAASFQKQLGSAVTPSQALDIWLPVLTELRRPADADAAGALAKKSLASSVSGSDDEAKARTTLGMSLLLKGNYDAARDEFQTVRRSPAYKADKPWAKIADAGLEATTDPLAPYRQPVVLPPVDASAAARSLDAGIDAYRAGQFEVAVPSLRDAAKNAPTDPVAWYFLGAARWAMGKTDEAKNDFAQGAQREKLSPLPARTISGSLRPLQGAVRDAIDRVRP